MGNHTNYGKPVHFPFSWAHKGMRKGEGEEVDCSFLPHLQPITRTPQLLTHITSEAFRNKSSVKLYYVPACANRTSCSLPTLEFSPFHSKSILPYDQYFRATEQYFPPGLASLRAPSIQYSPVSSYLGLFCSRNTSCNTMI